MGYFSNAAIGIGFRNDWVTTAPHTAAERTMIWLARRWALMERSDELEQRQADLIMHRWMRKTYPSVSPHGPEEREYTVGLCMEETEHVLPEHLFTVEDVRKAIDLVEQTIADIDREETLARKRDAADICFIPGQTVLALAELRTERLA